jgi:hypothetical protein
MATATVPTPTPSTPTPVLHQHDNVATTSSTQTAALRTAAPDLAVTDDVNSGVVINISGGPNELPIGTMLKATLQQPISTQTTLAGTRFTAALSTDISSNGVVLLPTGSLIYGRITQIHGGRAIGGPSAIRLQPDSISLPDGATYKLNADVTDLDHFKASHVNDEGTIVGDTHPGTSAALGVGTTGAIITGAMIGGGVGAVVGLGIGAGVATVWWLKQDRQQELPSGTEIAFTLNNSLQLNPAAH